MPTDNKSLTIYLETEILEALTDYCLSHGITRRDKTTPILATGAVNLLKQALGLTPNITCTVQVNDDEIEKRFSKMENVLAILQDKIADLQSSKDSEEASVDLDPVKEKDDPISNCSPIFTDPDPDPSPDDELGELIEQKLQGKQGFITTSNLWKLLGLQGNKPEQEKAEVILIDRGCTKQKGSSTDGTKTGWNIL